MTARAATISKDFEFSASHQLTHLPDDHPCARLHGHNYIARVTLSGPVNERTGFVLDYRALAPFKAWVDDNLDHQHLNDVVALHPGPTSENLAEMLAGVLSGLLGSLLDGLEVTVAVSETPKTWASITATARDRMTWPDPTDPAVIEALDAADRDRWRWGLLDRHPFAPLLGRKEDRA